MHERKTTYCQPNNDLRHKKILSDFSEQYSLFDEKFKKLYLETTEINCNIFEDILNEIINQDNFINTGSVIDQIKFDESSLEKYFKNKEGYYAYRKIYQ